MEKTFGGSFRGCDKTYFDVHQAKPKKCVFQNTSLGNAVKRTGKREKKMCVRILWACKQQVQCHIW